MNDLIKIEKTVLNGAETNSVNSRVIYDYLEVATAYSEWIKRAIEKYDFIENEDYIIILTDSKSGKRDLKSSGTNRAEGIWQLARARL